MYKRPLQIADMSSTSPWTQRKIKKLLLKNWNLKTWQTFAAAHIDKPNVFWRKTLWSDKSKTELFSHNDKRYVWSSKDEAFKPNNTTIMLFAANITGTLHKEDGIMKKYYHNTLQLHLKSTTRWLKVWDKYVLQEDNDPKHTLKLVLEWTMWTCSMDIWVHARNLTSLNELYQGRVAK